MVAPDRDVVEADVRRAAGAAGVEAVVLDHLDAGFLRRVDDRAAGARVDADEHDHARAVGDGLLGLRLLRGRVALGVDDGVLDAGVGERLVEVAAGRRSPSGASSRCRAGAPRCSCRRPPPPPPVLGRAPVSAARLVVVVPAAARGDERERRDERQHEDQRRCGAWDSVALNENLLTT